MRYLLDGYNLAHWLAHGLERGDELGPEQLRQLLLARLVQQLPADAAEVTLFWDAGRRTDVMPDNEYYDWGTAHFVRIADDAIIDAVAAAERPSGITVVSRDREVTGKSRQLGARTMEPVELLGKP